MKSVPVQALALFAVGLLASLLFCRLIYPRLGEASSGIDPDGYGAAGQALYTTGRFQVIDKAPLYPAFIALVAHASGGHRLWTIQLAQCLLWAITVVILFALFRRTLGEDERAPFAAGLACALYPMSLWYTPRLWTETFLTFGIALYSLALVALLQRPSVLRAILCGFAAGFIALSKGLALVFFPLTLLALAACFRRSAWRWAALFSLAALACLIPWSWRNWRVAGALIPIHIDGGYNFYLGNGFARHWPEAPFSYAGLKALALQDLQHSHPELAATLVDPVQRDQKLLRAALAELVETPALLPRKLLVQSLTFWYLAADFPKSLLTGLLQLPVAVLAVIGAGRGWRLRSWALCLLIPVLGVLGVSVLVLAFARLSATILPYCLGLAVYGLWPWLGRRLTRMTPE
jgi:4-amino-4-deoxy-L-arabinose transferase-like glycosyltransferase